MPPTPAKWWEIISCKMTATLRHLSPSVFPFTRSLACGKWVYTWRAVLRSSEHDHSSVEQSAKGIHHLWNNSCQLGRKKKGRGSSNSRQTFNNHTKTVNSSHEMISGKHKMCTKQMQWQDRLSAKKPLNNFSTLKWDILVKNYIFKFSHFFILNL